MRPESIVRSHDRFVEAVRVIIRRFNLPTTFIKFLIVGGIGFIINQAMLFLFYDSPLSFLPAKDTHVDFGLFTHPDIRLLMSSILAVEVAIVAQFNFHERWTFRYRARHGWIVFRFVKFNASAALSPIIVVITINTLTPIFGISPYISNAIGVLIGFTWNWVLNTLVIWPHHGEPGLPPAPAAVLPADAGRDLPGL